MFGLVGSAVGTAVGSAMRSMLNKNKKTGSGSSSKSKSSSSGSKMSPWSTGIFSPVNMLMPGLGTALGVGLSSSLNTSGSSPYGQTVTTMPTMPNIEYPSYPEIDEMSYEEALRQAGSQIDPQTELARINLLKTYQEQRKRLPQYVNARGQLYGGLREGGEASITQKEAQSLDELSTRAAAEKARLASDIQNRADVNAREEADRWYQSELNRAKLAMDEYNTRMTNYYRTTAEQNDLAYRLKALALQQQAMEDENRYREAGLTGTYDGQPTLEYLQYMASPMAQDWYLPLTRQSMEADIKNALRSANQPYSTVRSSGGSSSTPKPTQTERQNSALADAYDAVDQAYNAGLTYDEIESNIKSQTSNLTRQGVDIQKVLDYAASKAPAAQEEPGWYSRLDQKLGGWLPFGSPR